VSEPSSVKSKPSKTKEQKQESALRKVLRRFGSADDGSSARIPRYAAALCVLAIGLAAIQGVTVQKIGFGPLQISFGAPAPASASSAPAATETSSSADTGTPTPASPSPASTTTPASAIVHGTHASWRHNGLLTIDAALTAHSDTGSLTLSLSAVNHTDVSVDLSMWSMTFSGSVGDKLTPDFLNSKWGSAQEYLAVGASGTGTIVFHYTPKANEYFTLTWPQVYQVEALTMDHLPWSAA
jgi:hypothetical protein